MNDLPRKTLSRIIAKHGAGICDSPKRVEAMLRDLCGAHRREINIIMGALEERVAADLMAAGAAVPLDVLFARLAARLRDNLAYTPEAARWGVGAWAVALGVLSEAELLERTGKESAKESAAASQSGEPPPVRGPESLGANPSRANPQAPRPQRGPTRTPARQPQQQQPGIRPPAPAPRTVPGPPSSIAVPEPPQHDISASPPSRRTSRRGLTTRGCLTIVVLVIVLIIAAVFVVPAVIMLLREEQATPSINEPRIR
jgi:hypothetical protein